MAGVDNTNQKQFINKGETKKVTGQEYNEKLAASESFIERDILIMNARLKSLGYTGKKDPEIIREGTDLAWLCRWENKYARALLAYGGELTPSLKSRLNECLKRIDAARAQMREFTEKL